METCIFLDLDNTIFQSQAKCPPEVPVEAVAYGDDDQPVSFMTERQQELFGNLSQGMIVPTTARTQEEFQRVQLPFHKLAILDFGGVVLHSGQIDRGWDETIRPQALRVESELISIQNDLEAYNQSKSWGASVRLMCDFGMSLYIVVKHPLKNLTALADFAQCSAWPRGDAWLTHLNGNNLSLVPRFLGKEHAVSYVIDTHLDRAQTLILGCADSTSDAAYLKLCDYAIIPTQSQLAQRMRLGG